MDSYQQALKQVQSPNSAYKILLLEDDPVDRELIEATLGKSGIRSSIVCVANRQDFLESLNTSLPDLILSDYVLPTFDGLAALKLAQAICPQIPFILVSGVLGEEQAIETLKQGATDYVLKQRLERIVPAVRRALRESQERQERQKLEKALRQTDNLLRAMVEASPVAIVTLTRERRVMTWNATAEKLYGWKAATVVDCPLPLIPKAQQEEFDCCIAQALDNCQICDREFRHLKQDRSSVEVSLSLAPLHDADDNIYGIVMTTVDITVRKQIEAQRLALLEQEKAARISAETASRIKDEFLAVLSHELRTPLNAIVGWSRLLKRGNLNGTLLQQALDTIERNATAQTQMIVDLLDTARIIRGQLSIDFQPVDATILIRNALEALRLAAKAKSIQVELALVTLPDRILADPSRLQQVLWNLLSNAIKFTPASGKVTVQCHSSDSYLKIQVSDSGIGIAPEFLPHVFDYFWQADSSITRSHGGLGFGLAITRHLVELHGGTIHVDSPGQGRGSTFTVMLPIREAEVEVEREFRERKISGEIGNNSAGALNINHPKDLETW